MVEWMILVAIIIFGSAITYGVMSYFAEVRRDLMEIQNLQRAAHEMIEKHLGLIVVKLRDSN